MSDWASPSPEVQSKGGLCAVEAVGWSSCVAFSRDEEDCVDEAWWGFVLRALRAGALSRAGALRFLRPMVFGERACLGARLCAMVKD